MEGRRKKRRIVEGKCIVKDREKRASEKLKQWVKGKATEKWSVSAGNAAFPNFRE